MATGKEGYTYAAIPDKLNRNKEDVRAKAIFVETENKFATDGADGYEEVPEKDLAD